jgi:hypothetical protein
MPMSESSYRVKLYGHTETDDETFCQELANALRIRPDQAKALLAKAPVVLKKKATEAQAERLRTVIQSVKGLCIIEEIDSQGEVSDTKKQQMESLEKILTRKKLEVTPPTTTPESSQMRTLIIGVIGSIFVVIALMYMSSVTPRPSDVEPTAAHTVNKVPANAPPPPEPEPLRSPEEIRDDMFQLEGKMDAKAMMLKRLREEVKRLYYKGPYGREQFKVKKEELLQARKEYNELRRELKDLKHELRMAKQEYGTEKGSVIIEQPSDYKFKFPGTQK